MQDKENQSKKNHYNSLVPNVFPRRHFYIYETQKSLDLINFHG